MIHLLDLIVVRCRGTHINFLQVSSAQALRTVRMITANAKPSARAAPGRRGGKLSQGVRVQVRSSLRALRGACQAELAGVWRLAERALRSKNQRN